MQREALSQAWEEVCGLNSTSLPLGVKISPYMNIGTCHSPSVARTDPSETCPPRRAPVHRRRAVARARGCARTGAVARAVPALAPDFLGKKKKAFVVFGSSLMMF